MSSYITFYIQNKEDDPKTELVSYESVSSIYHIFERYAPYHHERKVTNELLLELGSDLRADEENAKLRLNDCARLEQLLSATTTDSLDAKVNLFGQICLDRARIEEELQEIQRAAHFLNFCKDIKDTPNILTFIIEG